MSTTPQFYAFGINDIVQISTANTARDGTGTIATLITAPTPGGCTIESINVRATGTTTAGQVRLFYREISTDTWRLISELAIAAVTPSATVQTVGGTFATGSIMLPAGAELGVSTHAAETFNVYAQGGRY
jgi:hypothetical protein